MSWKTLKNEWGSTTDKGDLVFWSAVLPDIYRLGDISELIIRTIVKNTVASRFFFCTKEMNDNDYVSKLISLI